MPTQNLPTAPNLFAKKRPLPKRFHQYRVFGEPARKLARVLRRQPVKPKRTRVNETLFVLPGRRDVVAKILDDGRFAMRRRVNMIADIETWEETANGPLPLPRPIVAMVSSYVPQMRAALSSFRDPAQLRKGLSRKTKVYDSRTEIEQIDTGDIRAFITKQSFEDDPAFSVSLRCNDAQTLQEYVWDMPVRAENQNIGDRMLA